jgi:chromosome segregation protein
VRGAAERALSERAERHDALSRRVYEARSARERLTLRSEQVAASAHALARRIERAEQELQVSAQPASPGESAEAAEGEGRIETLQAQLAEIQASREQEIEREIAELQAALIAQTEQIEQAQATAEAARAARTQADAQAEQARGRLAAAEREAQDARRESARVGAELAAANQFLRGHARVGGEQPGSAKALSEELRVQDGYELALAAALGGRLDAAVVEDVAGAEAVLDRAGPDGGSALLAISGPAYAAISAETVEPTPGAQRLMDLLSGPPPVLELARRLLADAWVVERLEELPADFAGIAATRGGRVWFAPWGEVRQLSEGGTERVLARRNERDRLIAQAELAAQAEHAARSAGEQVLSEVRAAEEQRISAEATLRDAERELSEAGERRRQTEWLIEQRRVAPAQGALAVRKAELEGELAAERRQAERRERERVERAARIERLRAQHQMDLATLPRAERLASTLALAGEGVQQRLVALEAELAADSRAGEEMTGRLRACAAKEAEIQAALRSAGETVTAAEVAAQRLRDLAGEAELELANVAERLGGEPDSAVEPEPLSEEEMQSLRARVERLTRRREQLGPVNPLAQEEYAEALAHAEELESQRTDLETALRELRGVIRETDRQIEETFEETFAAAARNFEELVGDVFPGGTGRLRLVADEQAPRPVLGGQPLPDGEGADAIEAAAEAESEAEAGGPEQEQLPGVEIEITPAGKSTKRLTLLSGGEKSMTALAFLFAVFLARPCPFYILDEVEAALDDLNLDRFLTLLRRHSGGAQFIVITHQRRTMEAADWLYGVSMGGNGVSKVLSRRLPKDETPESEVQEVAEVA